MGEKSAEKKKLSYEELNNVAGQLQQQNKFLMEQLQKQNSESFYKRLDYLYKTIEFKSVFPEEFVSECVNEIVDTITIKVDDIKQDESK